MQNVGRPRFYISWGDYWRSAGLPVPRYQTISPHRTEKIFLPIYENSDDWYTFAPDRPTVPGNYPDGIDWVGVLNHNLGFQYPHVYNQFSVSEGYKFIIKQYHSNQAQVAYDFSDVKVNIAPREFGGHFGVEYSGFSIGTLSSPFIDMGHGPVEMQVGIATAREGGHWGVGGELGPPPSDDEGSTFDVGCWVYGKYYDMPVSPNLSLTLTREYGGSHEMTTINGSTISNTMWSAPPKWGKLPQWTLRGNVEWGDYDPGGLLAGDPVYIDINDPLPNFASGRRVWNLSFSYMDEGDLWGGNQSLYYLLDGRGIHPNDISHTAYTGASILVIQQNMQTEAALQYADFTDVSINGFTGTCNFGDAARATTYGDLGPPLLGIEFEHEIWYQVSFDLDIASGVGPEVCLALSSVPRSSIQRAEAGHNTLYFTLTGSSTDYANCVRFSHRMHDITSTITVSNITVIPGSSFAIRGMENNIFTGNNFFSQVWQKTLGGTLPFIFQPDKDNNNVDQFAICKFRENSLKATQTAPSVYDISVVIEEVW